MLDFIRRKFRSGPILSVAVCLALAAMCLQVFPRKTEANKKKRSLLNVPQCRPRTKHYPLSYQVGLRKQLVSMGAPSPIAPTSLVLNHEYHL